MPKPTDNLADGIRAYFPKDLMPWDDYYATMAQTDFYNGTGENQATKAFFIRKAPFGGSYAILGGLTAAIVSLADLDLSSEDFQENMQRLGYKKEFLSFLKDRKKIQIKLKSIQEGQVFFPNEPAIIMEGPVWAVRLAEGIILESVNYPTLAMTKWNRMRLETLDSTLMEFALRRAQDPKRTALYAHLAGADITSYADISKAFKIPVKGTMGHEFILTYGEKEAFDIWLRLNGDKPTLLVDTIDTLKSGVPNAIAAFKKHKKHIEACGGKIGIRLDSGDFVSLVIESYKMFQAEGIDDFSILLTNDLDEYSIQEIKRNIFTNSRLCERNPNEILSRIIWAAGTKPGTCHDQPSLGGVAKLTSIVMDDNIFHTMKLAKDAPEKCSIPGSNVHSWAIKDNKFVISLIHSLKENPNAILRRSSSVYSDRVLGYSIDGSKAKHVHGDNEIDYFLDRISLTYDWETDYYKTPTLGSVRADVKDDLAFLSWNMKTIHDPKTAEVYLSRDVSAVRQKMINTSAVRTSIS